MMLRKRSRPVQKEPSRGQPTTDPAPDSSLSSDAVHKSRSTSFFSVPRLFVGLTSKGLQDSDSARSPTSPLDFKVFSNLGNPVVRSPRSPGLEGPRKSWDCDRVGLGLVDSLNDETRPRGKVLGSSESGNILFGSHLRISIPSPKTHLNRLVDNASATSPKSLPKSYMLSSQAGIGSPSLQSGSSSEKGLGSLGTHLDPGELEKIQSCSADICGSSLPLNWSMYRNPKSNSEDFSSGTGRTQLTGSLSFVRGVNFDNFSGSLPVSFGSFHGFMGSLSASEIELSEDYTRVTCHGPNPKTTHIFGDCILESHTSELPGFVNEKQGEEELVSSWMVKCSSDDSRLPPAGDFLSFCYSCKKKLEEGKDIYMYRGEKAFCSCSCRLQEILIEEEMEKPATDPSDSPRSNCHEEIFADGIVFAT